MPTLTIQLGQCGNQLGSTFLNTVFQRSSSSSPSSSSTSTSTAAANTQFFYPPAANGAPQKQPTARAILIDAETKVTEQVMQWQKGWKYDTRFRICLKEGAGNCWTTGATEVGTTLAKQFIATVTHQMRRHTDIDTFLVFNSLAGGTGAGVGSVLTGLLKKYFPEVRMIVVSILPFWSGDVVVQNYNVVLALSQLMKNASAMILFCNDFVTSQLARSDAKAKVGIDEINQCIANQLADILCASRFSLDVQTGLSSKRTGNHMGEILDTMQSSRLWQVSRTKVSTSHRAVANEEQSLSVYADVNTTMKPPELIRLRSTLKGKAGIIRIVRDSAGFEEFTQLSEVAQGHVIHQRLLDIAWQCLQLYRSGAFLHHYGAKSKSILDSIVSIVGHLSQLEVPS